MYETKLSGLTVKGSQAAKAEQDVLIIDQPGDYILFGKSDEASAEIRCETGPVCLTLHDVYIDMSERRAPALLISSGAGVELSLQGDNTLYGGAKCAAVQNGMNLLTVVGKGVLNAYGGCDAAAIGGALRQKGGNITISGGHIKAYGGFGGAGIGGGQLADGECIVIDGGRVTARGGRDVIAFMSGGTLSSDGGGAGIGGGEQGDAHDILIAGGEVDARGGDHAAGIGGGVYGTAKKIIVSDGHVTAHGCGYAEGIGCGGLPDDDEAEVLIIGGTVNVTCDEEDMHHDESDGF